MTTTTTDDTFGFTLTSRSGEAVKLDMQELWVTGQVLPVGARLIVRHVFQSAEREPVEAVYAFAMPRDGALRRFEVTGDGFGVHSELREVLEANRIYEEAIEAGSLTTMAKVYRDGLVNLTVGNLQPKEQVTVLLEIIAGVEVRDDGYRFRFPFTLAPTYHAKARTVESAPGTGEIELPEQTFGDLLLPPFQKDAAGLHRVGFDLHLNLPDPGATVQSPSHSIRVANDGPRVMRVALAPEADLPNRDLIIEVANAKPTPAVFTGQGEDGETSVAAVLPSTCFGEQTRQPKELVFVLDRSGSMGGEVMTQAKRALRACLATLSADDHFGIVAFDHQTEFLSDHLLPANSESREEALAFLESVDARGGTELAEALTQAATLLREDAGSIFLLTDGQVSESESILAEARAHGRPIHVLGIGSASQDRFLTLLARETGGVSRYPSEGERVDLEALALFASISSPIASALCASLRGIDGGTIEPAPPTTAYSGSPVVIHSRMPSPAQGNLQLTWHTHDNSPGSTELSIVAGDNSVAETLRLIRGARLITNMEIQQGTEGGRIEKRRHARVERALVKLGTLYGLANRAMALVAVHARETDQAGVVPKTRITPVGMPGDTPFESYFASAGSIMLLREGPSPDLPEAACFSSPTTNPSKRRRKTKLPFESRTIRYEDPEPEFVSFELAMLMEPDGGMPGNDEEARIAISLLALLVFTADGDTGIDTLFRVHVERLMEFLNNADVGALTATKRRLLESTLSHLKKGRARPSRWTQRAETLIMQRADVEAIWSQIKA